MCTRVAYMRLTHDTQNFWQSVADWEVRSDRGILTAAVLATTNFFFLGSRGHMNHVPVQLFGGCFNSTKKI